MTKYNKKEGHGHVHKLGGMQADPKGGQEGRARVCVNMCVFVCVFMYQPMGTTHTPSNDMAAEQVILILFLVRGVICIPVSLPCASQKRKQKPCPFQTTVALCCYNTACFVNTPHKR